MADYSALITAFDANCAYDLNQSAAECSAFIQACRKLLTMPEQSDRDGERVRLNHDSIRQQLDAAIQWYNQNVGAGAGVTHLSIEEFRT